MRDDDGPPRFGFTVTKRTRRRRRWSGTRIRRRLREAARARRRRCASRPRLRPGWSPQGADGAFARSSRNCAREALGGRPPAPNSGRDSAAEELAVKNRPGTSSSPSRCRSWSSRRLAVSSSSARRCRPERQRQAVAAGAADRARHRRPPRAPSTSAATPNAPGAAAPTAGVPPCRRLRPRRGCSGRRVPRDHGCWRSPGGSRSTRPSLEGLQLNLTGGPDRRPPPRRLSPEDRRADEARLCSSSRPPASAHPYFAEFGWQADARRASRRRTHRRDRSGPPRGGHARAGQGDVTLTVGQRRRAQVFQSESHCRSTRNTCPPCKPDGREPHQCAPVQLFPYGVVSRTGLPADRRLLHPA